MRLQPWNKAVGFNQVVVKPCECDEETKEQGSYDCMQVCSLSCLRRRECWRGVSCEKYVVSVDKSSPWGIIGDGILEPEGG